MNRKRALLGVALAVLGALETAKAALGAVPERLANPDAFCLRAFSAMVANDDSRTVIVSPESLSTALMMLALGARGETAAEFDRAFEVRSGEMYEATKLHIARTQALMAADPRIDFRTANGLFVERNLKLKPEYVVKITGDFKARVETLDFGAPAVRIINRWFNDETKGLIPEMLKELTPVMRLVLANAIYFKGKWSVAFDAKNTEPHPFKTASGAMRPVQMMFHPNQSLAYRETPWFQTVKLPYGEGGYEAVVLLPWRGREIATWLSHATRADWDRLMIGDYSKRPGELGLPKMNLSVGGENLRPLLAGIGLDRAMSTDRADYSGIFQETDWWIDLVVHRVVLKVDETGTEAAGATAMTMVRSMGEPASIPFRMIVDRPFLIAIRHLETGALLFVGYIADPVEIGS